MQFINFKNSHYETKFIINRRYKVKLRQFTQLFCILSSRKTNQVSYALARYALDVGDFVACMDRGIRRTSLAPSSHLNMMF